MLGVDREHQPVEKAPPLRAGPANSRSIAGVSQTTRRWSAKAAAEATGSRSMRHSARARRGLRRRRLDAGAERREAERAFDLGRDRPGAVAFGERDLLERGAAQAAARRQKRDRLDQIGLAGAVRPDQHDQAARRRRGSPRGSCGNWSASGGGCGRRSWRQLVMTGLVPAIQDRSSAKAVDARHKPGMRRMQVRQARSHPHRHQHVERALGVLVLDQRRRAGIGELEHRDLALDLRRDVEQVARVEADIERIGVVLDLESPRWRCRNPDW